MATAPKPIDDDSFKFKLNGAEFYCFFLLTGNPDPPIRFTGQDANEGILLTKSSIVSLDIHENFFAPEIVGSITINNPYNYIEDELISSGTGEDYLHVRFIDYETFEKGNPNVVGSTEPQATVYQDKGLFYSFVLQDESNSISKTDRSNNFKTYALIDKNFHRLNRESEPGIRLPSTNEIDQPIGDIIKRDIFKKVFGGDGLVDEDQFTKGSHYINGNNGQFPNYIEHLTPGLHWRYSDALKYLLRFNYVVSQGQTLPVQPFLQYNRDTGKYTYIPLDDYFKNNEKLTIEAMGIGDLQGDENAFSDNKSNPVSKKTNPDTGEQGVFFNNYQGMLHNTNLTTPFTTYTNEYFSNYIVKSTDNIMGAQKSVIIEIANVAKEWESVFIDEFRCVGGAPTPFIPFYKGANQPVKPFSLPNFEFEDSKNLVTAQMVSNLTFYNLQLTLDIPGDTFRRPGRFIDVFKAGQEVAVSDSKLLGKWFITSVHHRFFKDKYQNVIICVKPYVGPENERKAALDGIPRQFQNIRGAEGQYVSVANIA
tara:strand:- start:34 stop:1641 length:1608 start_codon:yes stop_codon:yes gene_type:complete